MDTILNYSVVTTGLLFGVIVLAIAALWVYWSKFFIPFSTYCWWRDRIPRIVTVYCFVSFGAWAFFYGRERNFLHNILGSAGYHLSAIFFRIYETADGSG